jgi:glutathione synthase/RimK-type ligase-like ATP-grasp enzyme
MHLAFVTYVKLPDLTEDDQLLANYLSRKNIVVTPVLWDDAAIDWQQFDAIVLRSMWDYFERPDEFNEWLDRLALLECNVLNPLSVVQWNQNKLYFNDFTRKGIQLPPYFICPQKSTITLATILKENGWNKAVVKPAISGGAYNTWVVSSSSASDDEIRFSELLQTGDIIVQSFVEEIVTKGELSLIFFNKVFSHAICKKVKTGDFRVQTQFGGTAEPIQPDKTILAQAEQLLLSIEEPLLYARVDGVASDNGEFLLMELELIEPGLSVFSNDKACENFHQGLLEVMAKSTHPLNK